MPSQIIQRAAERYKRPIPDLQPGYTVRVHERIQEGEKERIQIFEGLIINVHKGHVHTDRSFTVRRIVSGVGVERFFSMCSPMIAKIEVKKVAKVRRAKLFFLRGRSGKNARLNERFTDADEFAVIVPPQAAVEAPAAAEEAPATEEKAPEGEGTQA